MLNKKIASAIEEIIEEAFKNMGANDAEYIIGLLQSGDGGAKGWLCNQITAAFFIVIGKKDPELTPGLWSENISDIIETVYSSLKEKGYC